MNDWLDRTDAELLLGPNVPAGAFNDTRQEVCLDHVALVGTDLLLADIVDLYLKRPDLPSAFSAHQDTTSLSMYGIGNLRDVRGPPLRAEPRRPPARGARDDGEGGGARAPTALPLRGGHAQGRREAGGDAPFPRRRDRCPPPRASDRAYRRGSSEEGRAAPLETVWTVTWALWRDEAAITAERRRASCFVLLTDHTDETQWTDKVILAEYRPQRHDPSPVYEQAHPEPHHRGRRRALRGPDHDPADPGERGGPAMATSAAAHGEEDPRTAWVHRGDLHHATEGSITSSGKSREGECMTPGIVGSRRRCSTRASARWTPTRSTPPWTPWRSSRPAARGWA